MRSCNLVGSHLARSPLTRAAATLALLAGSACSALAQDSIATAPTNTNESESFNPGDVPGREKGPRRPDADKPAEEQKEESKEPAKTEWFGGISLWEWSHLTGDWGGCRTRMEAKGFTFDASYTLDWSSVWEGGLNNVASTRSLLSMGGTFDFEKMFDLKGASFFVGFESADMRGGSRDVGDYAGVSNIDTGENVDDIPEVWYQQKLFDDKLRLKLGKVDANLEFAFPDFAGEFLNSAAAYSSTSNITLPTYPNPAMGAVAFVYPVEWLYVGAGFFDNSNAVGVPTGTHGPNELWHGADFLWIGETGITWNQLGSLGKGRLAFGGWHSTAEFARFDGGTENGTNGFYANLSQQLIKREGWKDDEDPRGLFAFAQYGWGDEDVNDAANHFGIGLSVLGTFAARDDDAAGLYFSFNDLSDDPNAGYPEDEYVIEGFYKIQLTPWLFVKPDIQYVCNPGGASDVDNAVVGAIRFQVSF